MQAIDLPVMEWLLSSDGYNAGAGVMVVTPSGQRLAHILQASCRCLLRILRAADKYASEAHAAFANEMSPAAPATSGAMGSK